MTCGRAIIAPKLELSNHLSANPTKWSNTLKQFVDNNGRVVWIYLTILWDWRLRLSYIQCNNAFKIWKN